MATSFGRLQAALAAATNEVTIAAANINFDFSLVKYEAPKEFQPLGALLAPTRKHDAETGRPHVTARRLGALFEGVCPDTPNLIKAYGTRVGEVSKQALDNEPKEYRDSIFSAYTGVDGTSIWAAATSSKTAIHVHMLACMLAECWDPPEAISIWEELVAERRRDIANRLENSEYLHIGLAGAAVQQEIPREELAAWDASARAWIQTARAVMLTKYTQLKLILKNLDIPVHENTAVFNGVTEAWKLTLETMEKLVSGIPQEVRIGAAVLGISAWHIYPDIHVFGKKNMEIKMDDPLVCKGGVLSLGCSPSESLPGIHWSLCLNRFKFYGPSLQRRQTLQENSNFIPFRNFHHAVIGALLSRWMVSSDEIRTALQVLISLCSFISTVKPSLAVPLNSTKIAAYECLTDPSAQVYLNYGRRKSEFFYCKEFDEDGTSSQPFFGLSNPQVLLACIPNSKDKVELLTRLATRVQSQDINLVIYDVSKSVAYTINSAMAGGGKQFFTQGSVRTRANQSQAPGSHAPRSYVPLSDDYTKSGPHLVRHSSGRHFRYWFGDAETAALFEDSPLTGMFQEPAAYQMPPRVTPEDLQWCLGFGMLSRRAFAAKLRLDDPALLAICHLDFAVNCFNRLSTVMVDVRVLGKPMLNQWWARYSCFPESPRVNEFYKFNTQQLGDQTTKRWIQVIANFAAGIDIHCDAIPSQVTGISIGDSLIVPSRLLNDPSDNQRTTPFTRILGNIGRPGFILLSSPADLMLAPLDDTSWKMCNMNPFDGKSEDMLDSTSMHLSLTDWSRPLGSTTSIGGKDIDGLVMESVVSIREHGKWVGDIDPINALESPKVFMMMPQEPCSHQPNEPPTIPMTAVECWDELRDCPEQLVVVKAHGNWVARLAATAYLVECSKKIPTKIKQITICPQKVCWACLKPEPETPSNIYIY